MAPKKKEKASRTTTRTEAYGKRRKNRVLQLYFEDRMTMKDIAKHFHNSPSYATVRRWVREERERVGNNKPDRSERPKKKKKSSRRGPIPMLTQEDVEEIQAIMEARRSKPKKKRLTLQSEIADFIEEVRRKQIGKINWHFLVEKIIKPHAPIATNSTRRTSKSTKKAGKSTSYTLLVLCNVEYGMKAVALVKNKKGQRINQNEFGKLVEEHISPLLRQFAKRGGEKQLVFMDQAPSHNSALIPWLIEKSGGELLYFPSACQKELSPMNDTLFAQVLIDYEMYPAETQDEIKEAVDNAFSSISRTEIKKSIERIYFQPRN